MKVGINCSLLYDSSIRGWNRYTINLLEHLQEHEINLYLYTQKPIHEVYLERLDPKRFVQKASGPMNYLKWQEYYLPAMFKEDGIDLFHGPFNYGLPIRGNIPKILTLHDAIDYAYYRNNFSLKELFSSAAIKTHLFHVSSRKWADHIITVSHHAKDDIIKYFSLKKEKVTVIYEAQDKNFFPKSSADILNKYKLRNKSYVFYIGGQEKRKNIPYLLEAFSKAKLKDCQLAIGGKTGSNKQDLLNLAQRLNIADKLQFLGSIPDEDLPYLYSSALCMSYPSFYEGFGLQICEAMACHCPTLVSNRTSLPEILGDGGESFSLDNPKSLAIKLERLQQDDQYRQDLVQKAKKRSQDFSWQKTSEETYRLYQSLIRTNESLG